MSLAIFLIKKENFMYKISKPKHVIGFTGTRDGMTEIQRKTFKELLSIYEPHEFHHGDCIGADAEAHTISKELGFFVVIHPPRISTNRANCVGDRMEPVKEYLKRNEDIVMASEVLFAIPKTEVEEIRSGTWSTIRKARQEKKTIYIIYPEGKVVKE